MANAISGGPDGPRVALLGAGRWGRHILRDLGLLGCDVIVVAPRPEQRAAVDEAGAQVVDTIGALPAVDGAVVATQTAKHAAVVEQLLDRDVPVFVEKPMTADPSSAAHLVERGAGRLFVMDKWRYHPGVAELARIAATGELGSVRALASRRVTDAHRYSDVDTVWVHLPHDLAIVLEIFEGRLPSPRAAVEERLHDQRVSLLAMLGGGGEPQVTIEISCVAPAHRRELRVVFDEGVALLDGADADAVLIRRSIAEDAPVEHRPVSGELPLLAELRAFVGHLQGGPAPRSSASEGAEVVRVIDELGTLAAQEWALS